MVEVIERERKGTILTPSSIPCLRKLPTINITQGCSLGCVYCYTKSYRGYPGQDRVIIYTNTADLVAQELKRRRKRPQRVYFSPSSDAFQDIPKVQQITYDTMQVLLDYGIEVAFLTKGFVSERFLGLFEKHSSLVYGQIGLTSLDRAIWQSLEPRTAPPEQRIGAIKSLMSIKCSVSARLDPLIPNLTDISPSIDDLMEAIANSGVTFAAASYIFWRPAFGKQLAAALKGLHSDQRIDEWSYHEFENGFSGGRYIDEAHRQESFTRLAEIGRRYGITVMPCRCKNPGLADRSCHISGSAKHQASMPVQLELPFE